MINKTSASDTDESSNIDETTYPNKPERMSSHHSAFIYLVTILSAIGGFLFGYDTGIVSGAMVFIRDKFELSDLWQEFIVSATILAAWLFSLIAGYLSNNFGRKCVILLASFVFTIGGFMMALAHNKELLLAGRFIVGAAIGLASMVIPVYIAEVAPVQIRGKLVTINACFITFGQFVASVIAGLFSSDHNHGWRWMLGLASVPSLIQLVCFAFMPESPRWLIQKGRYDDAYSSLAKFRSNTSAELIGCEFDSIKTSCLDSQRVEKSASIGRILRTPSVLRALFVGSMLMMFQQLAGINTVMYYSATIIQMSGVHDKSLAVWLSALTASINFVFSFVGMFVVERLGRRLLTLSSLFGVVLALVILGFGFQLAENNSPPIKFHAADQDTSCSAAKTCGQCISSLCGFCYFPDSSVASSEGNNFKSIISLVSNMNSTCLSYNQTDQFHPSHSSFCANGTIGQTVWTTQWCPSDYSIMTLAGLMLYLFFFAPGMGPMPWTVNSEIYPLWARSFCYSVATSFNWFFNLLVSLTFLSLTKALTNHGAYYLYAGIAFIGWIMFFIFLPETKGKTLEQIECVFEYPLFKLGIAKPKKRTTFQPDEDISGSTNSNSSNITTTSNVQA